MREADKLRFELCAAEVILSKRKESTNIGTYKEKRLHQVLKNFCEPDALCHEVSIGQYVADILKDDEIIEIQTGSFYPMRNKIKYYLEKTNYKVTVVRPLPYIKWCLWIDPDSSEIVSRRKSPKKFQPKDIMRDWIYLSDFLCHERFKIKFLLIEEEEYRLLCGWSKSRKQGSKRYERIPLKLIDEKVYKTREDYMEFLPESLGKSFTAAEYIKTSKQTSYGGYAALKILSQLGLLRKSDKKEGRKFIYTRI
ncbi:MAG: hypothetical protein U0M06_03710 [Clostridia bacterium]|nr:hypothetical protein [Clostridia bacterium]